MQRLVSFKHLRLWVSKDLKNCQSHELCGTLHQTFIPTAFQHFLTDQQRWTLPLTTGQTRDHPQAISTRAWVALLLRSQGILYSHKTWEKAVQTPMEGQLSPRLNCQTFHLPASREQLSKRSWARPQFRERSLLRKSKALKSLKLCSPQWSRRL